MDGGDDMEKNKTNGLLHEPTQECDNSILDNTVLAIYKNGSLILSSKVRDLEHNMPKKSTASKVLEELYHGENVQFQIKLSYHESLKQTVVPVAKSTGKSPK